MLHICYGLNDTSEGLQGRYAKFVGTSMTSIFENTSQAPPPGYFAIHIFHDSTLTEENRDKLNYIAGYYRQKIEFCNVEKILPEKIAHIKKIFGASERTFSIAAFFRVLLAEIIDEGIEKVIFIDADTVVNLDINELWQIDLGDKILAAISQADEGVDNLKGHAICKDGLVKPENYFNTGMLLINLNLFRQERETIEAGIKFIAENPRYWFFDQDVLNYCFSENYLHLPTRFNIFAKRDRLPDEIPVEKKIYHFTWDSLRLNSKDSLNRLWFKYFCKTPWCNEDVFGNIFEGVRKVYNEGKSLALQTARILSGKKRGFFVAKENIDAVKNIFAVEEGEEIIFAESIENLIQSMKKSQGKKVYFVFATYFPAVHQALTSQGFEFGVDFLNGIDYLSEAQGVTFNSGFLINIL